ncbi:serine/threonine-protein kinase and phosphatase [[Clostridium] sordellii]|uniref:Stk1 family PASTA domain-containing Ser/Thr kinase n=1 Tax=Paraclostridium sordellii TaxID=1505 RepID=UPI0005E342F4|nr:Stk1 family PASTA domain-containing Ser/Thr kinase [Paeniclostridium sordellii]CEN76663.1 serine/threonine-protein kinase and phosphatase [[Clostridium] sordellii] [Paeniclostridium sordellii]
MGETVLGNRYEIIKKIGDGGMAFVYEARDKLLNRTVAIKVLRPEFVDDEEFLSKFKREAEAVASLSHPNIVNVYDVGEDGKVHYIVMELIEGQNLKDIIKNEGTLDEYTALDITKQIAKALGAAHKKGIIHRDIKPHNILISNEGRIVKVADFGIAKAVSSSTMTSTGSVIGSVHYFSPEQAKGKFVGKTTDLYSLGIVLYEMIIGRVPFRGDSPISIALQHINDEIEFTQEEKVAIPQSVRNIIKKLTSKASADRYQSADEIIEDIEYIEKNIDLDFIKEYDNYATQKIDENELNKALKLGDTNPKLKYDEEDLEEAKEERKIPKKSKKRNKKSDNPKSKRRWKIAAVILSLILIAQIIFIGKIALGFKGNKVEQGTAPELINKTLDEAQDMAKELGVNIRVSVEEYNDKIDKNHIISQAPNAGSAIKAGDTITVVVSKGKNHVSAPGVVGLTLSDAENVIKEKGFVLGTINYEYSDSHDKDVVISQSPDNRSLKPGDKINVVVSRGPKPVEQKPVTPEPPKEQEQPVDPNKPTDEDSLGTGTGSGSTTSPGDGSSGGQSQGGTTDGSGGGLHPGSGSGASSGDGSVNGSHSGGDTEVNNQQPNSSGHQQ